MLAYENSFLVLMISSKLECYLSECEKSWKVTTMI